MSFMSRSNKRPEKNVDEYPVYRPQKTEVPQPTVADESYVGKTMKIEGDLTSDENLTIEGIVKGTITVGKTLTIGQYGNVSADIDANIVRIIGRAKGNIRAKDKVIIQSLGKFEGNVWSEKMVVAEGAILMGNINQEGDPVLPASTYPVDTTASDSEDPDKKEDDYSEEMETAEAEIIDSEEPQSQIEETEKVDEEETDKTDNTDDTDEANEIDESKEDAEKPTSDNNKKQSKRGNQKRKR